MQERWLSDIDINFNNLPKVVLLEQPKKQKYLVNVR